LLLCLPAEKLFSKSAKSLVRSSIQAERGWDWDLSCDRVEQDSGSPLHSLGRVVPQSGSSLLSPRYDVIPSQSRGYPPVHIYIRYRFRGPQILRAQIYDYNTHGNPPPPREGVVTCLKVSANYFLGDLLVIFDLISYLRQNI